MSTITPHLGCEIGMVIAMLPASILALALGLTGQDIGISLGASLGTLTAGGLIGSFTPLVIALVRKSLNDVTPIKTAEAHFEDL